MEPLGASSLLTFCFLFLMCVHLLLRCTLLNGRNLPPGPRPLPVLGNILKLGTKPHRALTELAGRHGPIMTLKLGSVTSVVVSSHEAAKEIFQKNDHVLCGRMIPDAFRAGDHHKHSVVWLPASAKWKGLWRARSMQMFSRQKLERTETFRRKKVDELLNFLHESSARGRAVNVRQAVFTMVLNLIPNTVFSIDLVRHDEDPAGLQFRDIIWGVMKEGGTPNISDYFPSLRWIDPQGARRRMNGRLNQLFAVFDSIMDERTKSRALPGGSCRDDMLDSLLDLGDSSELSREDINHLLCDLFAAGVDTTHSTVEWAMAELLRHQDKMAKARAEMEQVLGMDTKVRESDIPKLPYLQAIVKEILRLYLPFLLPCKAESEVDLCGFKIPKNTQVMVNLWAMGRDPSVWHDPDSFQPERFSKLEIDIRGTDFELMPFGAGRRICLGMPLAYKMVHLILGSMIQSFDWELGNGETPETMDMSEEFGITLHRTRPLYAIPIALQR